MKNLRLFDTFSQFNTNKDNIDKPYVVSCKDGKLVYSIDVEEENKMVKVLYVAYDVERADEGNDYELDEDHYYQYNGTVNIDNNVYYKWQKVKSDSELPFPIYILTDTLDFNNVSLENPMTPIGFIDDDITDEGAYEYDVIVGVGEKMFVSVEINVNLITPGDYIDLGLTSGTKWASCNLGASKPCEYGDYYAWGETTPKEVYFWSTYKYGSDYYALTKYNTDSNLGIVDNKTVLEPEDDAVYVATNGDAHMPTDTQIDELLKETESRWGSVNGVFGRLFTGSNGNAIFIPASGVKDGSFVNYRGNYIYVWSASLNKSIDNCAWELDSKSDKTIRSSYDRRYGLSVRGCKD